MNRTYLQEAFKQLDILNEEDFRISSAEDSFTEIKDAADTDEAEIESVEIIDDEAETEEELEDSYIGKVILDCEICHSKIYKNADEVQVDEESGLANIEEECPYCFSTDGFKVIGEVAPFKEEPEVEIEITDKEEVEEIPEEEEEAPEEEVLETEEDEELKEDLNNIELDTEDQHISISSEEKEPTGEEMIAPVSLETEEEITPEEEEITSDDLEDSMEDISAEDEEADIDMDEIDEESFDELGESFLKKTYENVNSFKTSAVMERENSLVIEGIIKFNSGKEKKTTFVFEAKDATKNGSLRFVGENKELSRGKKSFTLQGKMSGNKFVAESLGYNYRAKLTEGKSVRIYGNVKKNF